MNQTLRESFAEARPNGLDRSDAAGRNGRGTVVAGASVAKGRVGQGLQGLGDVQTTPAAKRVAIVADDHELFRLALVALLTRQLGFDTVIEAATFDEALERLADTADVALALFDLGMPGVGSAASLATVRTCFPAVRTVVVSGSTDRNDVLLALQAGAHGYVAKETSAGGLARALSSVMEGHIYVPAFLAELPVGRGRSASEPAARLAPSEGDLTPRQCEILELIVKGASNKEIARALRLGEGTVKVHVAALFRALGVHNRSSAAAAATRVLAGRVTS